MTNPTGRDELVERIARALIEPLGYSAGVDWERTWVGNQCDDVETGSLAYLCRTLARAALATIEASRNDGAAINAMSDVREALDDPEEPEVDYIPALRNALERLSRNFDLLLSGKPVRDVAETRVEVAAALAAGLSGGGK